MTMVSDASRKLRRCVYVGGLYKERDVLSNRAVSTAGNRWQRGFLHALSGQFDEVAMLAHHQERVFPFGSPYPKRGGFDWEKGRVFAVRYLNLPRLRVASLRRGYAAQTDRALAEYDHGNVVICYNASPWTAEVARRAWARYRVPTICLHADFPDMHGDWSGFERMAAPFAGNVFFSYGAFLQSPVRNKFHFDGGFERETVRCRDKTGEGAITYAGNIAESKGVAKLVECFSALPGDGLRLQLFGKLDAKDGGARILRLCRADRRIAYFGVVPYEELEQALAKASVLVNPVDVQMRGNPLNFPSKLHHYLEMGPPVVSAMAEGIAPVYLDLIYCVDQDRNQSEWGRRIMAAAQEEPRARTSRLGRVETFLRDHLWSRQVARLVTWMETWQVAGIGQEPVK